MYVAVDFAVKEMKLDSQNLILVVLAIQLVAIPGAYFFARLSQRKGNLFALKVLLVLWIIIVATVYFIYVPLHFYLIAGAVGLVMGGIQSTSRATYTKLIPEKHSSNASFFSFYSAVDKVAIIFGTLVFGLVNEWNRSMRPSILFLTTWLAIGLLVLIITPWKRLLASEDHEVFI
jgi:UMF1 family MFS transporter